MLQGTTISFGVRVGALSQLSNKKFGSSLRVLPYSIDPDLLVSVQAGFVSKEIIAKAKRAFSEVKSANLPDPKL